MGLIRGRALSDFSFRSLFNDRKRPMLFLFFFNRTKKDFVHSQKDIVYFTSISFDFSQIEWSVKYDSFEKQFFFLWTSFFSEQHNNFACLRKRCSFLIKGKDITLRNWWMPLPPSGKIGSVFSTMEILRMEWDGCINLS